MNCSKCNSILADGIKFCPNCGTAVLSLTPEPAQKYVCQKCGLEVTDGAKFCFVCGGAVVAQEASPADSSNMGSAVSLDKPSASDELVSAMNSAASSVPTPSDNGYAAPSSFANAAPSSAIPEPVSRTAPTFAPSSDAADTSDTATLPNYNGGAAVAERPVKKKHKGRVALIIIGAVAALLAAAAIMFFTNRATVLSTVMGKSKYAAMVEGNHIKKVAEQIDMTAVSDGIKAGSSVMPYFMVAQSFGNNYYYSSNALAAAPMIYDYGYNSEFGIDLSAIEEMYAELLANTYGKNTINASIKANIDLGDSLKSILEHEFYYYYYDFDIDDILDYVNDTTLTYSVSAKEDALAVTAGAKGKITADAKVLLDGQDMYISLPFISDRAVKLTFNKPASSSNTNIEIKPLELDADELERIISDIIKIYLDHYKKLEIEIDNGELSAAGVSVSGKLITAEFSVKDLFDLLSDVMEYIAEDDYLAGQIVEFANSMDADIDEDDYYDAIMDLVDEMDYDEDSKDKLIIETVIDRNGNVLGKTYTVGKKKAYFSFASTKEQSGIEIKGGDTKITLVNEKENAQNGSCTLKVTADGDSISMSLKYSDVKKAEFCGNDILTGKFDLSMKLPDEFKYMLDDEAFAAMNGAKLSLSINSKNSDSLETTVSVKANSYINASITETLSVSDNTSAFNAPTGVIDLTPLTKGEYIDENSADELVGLIKDAVNKFIDMGLDIDPDILDYLDPSELTGLVSKEDIDDMLDEIDEYIDYLDYYIQLYFEFGYMDKYIEYNSLKSKFTDLSNRIKAKNYKMTQDEYYNFDEELFDLYYEMYYYY